MADIEGLIRSLTVEDNGGSLTVPPIDPTGAFIAAGTLAGLTVSAAAKAFPDAEIRSAHSVFLRAASPADSLSISVEPVHLGRQMSVALVQLNQNGRTCASSHVVLGPRVDDLIVHQSEAPVVASAESSPPHPRETQVNARVVGGVDPFDIEGAEPPRWHVWVDTRGVPGTGGMPEAFVAVQANAFLVSASVLPHKGVSMLSAHNDLMAVINTSDVIFHRPVPVGSWLLFSQESTAAAGGWVYGRGEVRDTGGTLIASFGEEAMLRAMPAGRGPGL